MNIKENTIRILRNMLYRKYVKTGERFRKLNRSLLRAVSPLSDPIAGAPSITSRSASDQWQALQPVWVLSTGRTGTNTLTELFKLSPALDAFHEPAPELFRFSFDYYQGAINKEEALAALGYLRDELVFRSFRDGFIYVETNNRVTYVADLLLELYPASKFIYIYRNPYDFIRSGMRRRYYSGHLRDPDRITPRPSDPHFKDWGSYSYIEKVAWNWKTVNEHCLAFLESLERRQSLSLSSEAFFEGSPSLMKNLFEFAGSRYYHPPASDIRGIMGEKHNAQTEGAFSKPKDWTDEQLERVDQIIAPVARRLSYHLLTDDEFQEESAN